MHSKIKALSQQLGISYKDAAHRLYMAEIEHLKMADSALKSYMMLKGRIDHIVSQEIAPNVHSVDKWAYDNYIFKDGAWVEGSK